MTHQEPQTASAVSRDPLLFQEKFDELAADLAPLFARREPRAHALASILPRADGVVVSGWLPDMSRAVSGLAVA
ncbi:hypothetical protein [Streptomyces sp. NPDC001978]|uniref:hypothetical protein n=1 Tax=Streptomyces sp. NPDC001978 TaxID=3364627 RepID=UPI003690508B